MTAIEPSTSEAKCSASAASAWLAVARAARCSAQARHRLTRDIEQQHRERNDRQHRRRRALAQPAPGGDQDAARQHIEHRDDAERGQAFDLAVAVMMFLVRRPVRHPHHHPGHDGGDQIDRGVQRLRDQRQDCRSRRRPRISPPPSRRWRKSRSPRHWIWKAGMLRDERAAQAVSSPSCQRQGRSSAQSPLIRRSGHVANCSDSSDVVPAKAGIHTPCRLVFARRPIPSSLRGARGYGSPPSRGRRDVSHHSRDTMRPSFAKSIRPKRKEGAGKRRVAAAPAARVQGVKHTAVTTGTPDTRHSLRNGFNGLFRALPGDEFVLSPSSRIERFRNPVGLANTPPT